MKVRLVSASAKLGVVSPALGSKPWQPRNSRSKWSDRMVRSAIGPTSASEGVRTPPVSTTPSAVPSGPRGYRYRRARRDHAGRRARDRGLLRPLEHEPGLEARLVAGGRPWQDRAAVYLLHQAVPGEHLEVSADRHVRDAEPLGQVAHPGAAIAPDGLQDQRLAVSG